MAATLMEKYYENKNATLKRAFVESNKYASIYNTLFNKAAKHEKEFGKDLAEFNINEIKAYLTSFDCGNPGTIKAYVSMIRNYCDYMASETNINTKDWEEIALKEVEECVSTEKSFKYLAPANIQDILELIPNPMDRFLVLGIYEGLKGEYYEELWDLRLSDINSTSLIAKLPTGRSLKISTNLYKLAAISDETNYYISIKGASGWMDYKMVGDRIMKYRPNTTKPDDKETQKIKITDRLYNLRKYTGRPEVTFQTLRNSGAIYMIKTEAAKRGIKESDVFDNVAFYAIRERYELKSATAVYKKAFKSFLNS